MLPQSWYDARNARCLSKNAGFLSLYNVCLRATVATLLCLFALTSSIPAFAQSWGGGCDVNVTINGPTSLCSGDSGTWYANYTGCTGSAYYTWMVDYSYVPNSNNSSFTTSFGSSGTHTISCTVTVSGSGGYGSGSSSITVSVGQGGLNTPTLTYTPTSPTTCDVITFSSYASQQCGGSGGVSYSWNFGDGNSATGSTVTHQYSSPGSYTVSVSATDGTYTSSNSTTVTVSQGTPSLTLSSISAYPAQPTTCDTVNFSTTVTARCISGAINFHWTFGDEATADTTTPYTNHPYANAGSYPVSVTATAGGYTANQSRSLTVSASSITINSITADPSSGTACDTINFSASLNSNCTNGAISYDWDFGDGSPHSHVANPSHAYPGAKGTNPDGSVIPYTVTLHVSAGGSAASGSTDVTINPVTITINSITSSVPSPTVCDSITFQASVNTNCSSGAAYDWDFGDHSAHAYTASPAHTYPVAGTYDVVLTVTAGGASAQAGLRVTVGLNTITITNAAANPSSGTQCDLIHFTASATTKCNSTLNYEWDFGDTSPHAFVANPDHTYGGPEGFDGNGSVIPYTATLTVRDSVSSASQQVRVTINPIWLPGGPPLNLRLTPQLTNGTTVNAVLAWDPPAGVDAQHPVDGYRIYSSDDNYSLPIATTSSTTYTIQNAGGSSCYKVRSYVKCLSGPVSDRICMDILRNEKPGSGCTSCGEPDPFSGNLLIMIYDPVMTRGYPLANHITINSQVVETTRPMGNAAFSYDIHVGTQPVYTNCQASLHWVLVDGDGTRLDFGPATGAPSPEAGVFSQLVNTGNGFILQNAGPPHAIGSAGNFTYAFNAQGQLLQFSDPQNNVQQLFYDGSGHLTRVLDINTQKQITFQWTGGLVSQVIQNGGVEKTQIGYQNGMLASVTIQNAQGVTVLSQALSYNADHTVSGWTRDGDPASAKGYTYSAHPSTDCSLPVMMANRTDSTGSTHLNWMKGLNIDAVSSTVVTNAKGGITALDFDTLGDVVRVTPPTLTGATQPTVLTYTYDAGRNLLSEAVNGVTKASYGYNGLGLLTSMRDSQGRQWSLTYNGTDAVSSQDPLEAQFGISNVLAYGDAAQPHIPTSATDGAGITWNISHNGYGQTTGVTPPAGSPLGAAGVVYDEQAGSATIGYPTGSADGNGDWTTYDAYDALGDLLQASTYPIHGNPNIRNSTQYGYDAAQRVTQVTLPDGKTVQYLYNGRDLTGTIGPDGTQYNYGYCGPCGALTGISGPMGWSLGWAYDGDHDLTVFSDARSKATRYLYGLAGEPTGATLPDGSTSSVLYDNDGRVRQVVNGRGHGVTLGYDNLDRVQTVTPPAGSGQAAIGYSYNLDDSIHQITDGAGTTTFTYLPNKRLSTVVYDYTASGLTALQELDYAYFPDGLRQSLTWKNGGNVVGVWNYSYDLGGRLTGISNAWGENTGWLFDGEGKLTRQQNANGTRLDIGYNQACGWPASLTYSQNGANPFASYSLTYDSGNNTVGNLTGIGELDGSTVGYGYDALYRLTGENRTGTNAASHSYDYDLAGNRTLVDNTSFTFDDANKLLRSSSGYPGAPPLSYDGDGNLLSISPYNGFSYSGSFAWDDFGHLSSATSDYTGATYGYDGFGHRVWMQPNSQPSYARTFYIFDGDLLLGEVGMRGSSGYGSPGYVPVATAAYTWGSSGLVSERLVGGDNTLTSGRSLWYAFGPQGETRQLTDSSGAVVDSYTYTAYGMPIASTGSDVNPFRYGGQVGYYSDSNNGTGLILCTNRWYSPSLGRWLSRDPIGYDGSDNLYQYCVGQPTNCLDPDGTLTIFIHGSFSNDHTWNPQFMDGIRGALKDKTNACLVHWNGKPGSVVYDGKAIEDVANQIKSYADKNKDEPIYIIAHSNGGNVGLLAVLRLYDDQATRGIANRVRLIARLETPLILTAAVAPGLNTTVLDFRDPKDSILTTFGPSLTGTDGPAKNHVDNSRWHTCRVVIQTDPKTDPKPSSLLNQKYNYTKHLAANQPRNLGLYTGRLKQFINNGGK